MKINMKMKKILIKFLIEIMSMMSMLSECNEYVDCHDWLI